LQNSSINALQARFTNLPSETPFEEKWIVPLTMTTESIAGFTDLATDVWLTAPNMAFEDSSNKDEWVILNLQQIGSNILIVMKNIVLKFYL